MTTATPLNLERAIIHLKKCDMVLADVIGKYSSCDLQPHKNYYQELVESIIGQQLSVKAGAAIRKRFVDLFDGKFPAPAAIINKSIEDLRSAGLSRAKAAYIQDLASHVLDNKIDFARLDDLKNEDIINELTAVKGIGEWTAHMFMMFCMGRLDVLAYGDLGIRSGIKRLYGFNELPSAEEVKNVATKNRWHPYESVACWYIWQSLDNKPK